MQLLNIQEIQNISGGTGSSHMNLNTEVPLSMMPYIANQFESSKVGTQFSELAASLTHAGFDVNQVKVYISFSYNDYAQANAYLLAK